MNLHNVNRYQFAVLIMTVCSLALTSAWVAEYVFGLLACPLCLYQRYYYIAAICTLAIHLFFLGGRYSAPTFMITSLILLGCALTAVYQVGVENHWIEVPEICTAQIRANSAEELKNLIYAQSPISCDEVQFSLFGLSMAAYNAMLAFGLGCLCLLGISINDEKKKRFARR